MRVQTSFFLEPERSSLTGHAVGLTSETLKKALLSHPHAKAIIMTYPDYWGTVLDQAEVFAVAKGAGLYILVDEAHGAHFQIGIEDRSCPPSALSLGADVVVQSTHKMLPSLTMSAWMHLSYELNDQIKRQIKRALGMFQSSSPSYLLLASLDATRAYVENHGNEEYKKTIASKLLLTDYLEDELGLHAINHADEGYLSDPFKLIVKANNRSGSSLLSSLARLGIWAEMADENHVLFVLGLGENAVPTNNQLTRIEQTEKGSTGPSSYVNKGNRAFSDVVNLKPVYESIEVIPINKAVNRVSAVDIIPYPPGVPLLYRGELINRSHIQKIEQLLNKNVRFQGHQPEKGMVVNVLGDER